MARKSRYKNISNKQPYSAALYVRLSNDDDDKKIESNSIVNQKGLLTNFIQNNNDIIIYNYYIDDGYTGINFNRPAFQKMMQDIKISKINCVIVKDLSRLGRNYVDVGRYIDQYFPDNNIRFIAINDGIDKIGSDFDMIVPIKNIFNENYSRDISKKVTSAFRIKALNGDFIGAFASYGYNKNPNNKNKLIIDPYAAEIVKKIFNLFNNGTSKLKIAKILNRDKILCPSEYKKQCGLKYNNGQRLELTKYWTYSTINHILNNEIYIGNMVQHKNIRSNFKTKKSSITGKENWIRVENTHDAIIDKLVWDITQKLLLKDTRQIDFNHNIHMFAGFVKCGDCGRAMNKVIRNGHCDLICGSYNKFGKSICTQHRIKYDNLEKIVLNEIQKLINKLCNINLLIQNSKKIKNKQTNINLYNKQILFLTSKLNKTLTLKKGIYEDFKDGILSKNEYFQYKTEYENDETKYKQQIKTIKENENISGEEFVDTEWFQSLLKYKNINQLNREIIAEIIDCIKIYENNKVEIYFNLKINQLLNIINI